MFRRLFSTPQPTTHLQCRHRIFPRSTRFVSCKASEYRWRPSKFHRIFARSTGVVTGKANEYRCRPSKLYVDPWPRGERLLLMSYSFCPNPKKVNFSPSEMDRYLLSSVFYTLHTSGQMFFSQTLGRRPRYITGLSDPRTGRRP